MRTSLELQLSVSEKRQALADITEKLNGHSREGTQPEDSLLNSCDELTKEIRSLETQFRASVVEEDANEKEVQVQHNGDLSPEDRELRSLESRVEFGDYISAAVEMRAVYDGAAHEFNTELNIGMNQFPMRMLAPSVEELERRSVTSVDTKTVPRSWVDRLFFGTASEGLGLTFESVEAGIASYPVTTGGPSSKQRGKGQATADGAWTIAVSELKPTRHAVRTVFSVEDTARIPTLEEAILRDLRSAIVYGMDQTIFKGDDGATPNAGDIVGLQTAGITETEITQANKVKADKMLEVFVNMVDGKHAESLGDLRVVSSVGFNALAMTSIHNATASNQTVAQFLRDSGMVWSVRGGLDDATSNGKFGAYVGRARGIQGAGVVPVWSQGEMIRDPYSDAAKGEVALTISSLWNFGLPRTDNYRRVKFVT